LRAAVALGGPLVRRRRLGREALGPGTGVGALLLAQGLDEGVELGVGAAGLAGKLMPLGRLYGIGLTPRPSA
jgi:hypothetical protein